MTDIGKFRADIQRTIKHLRAENNGKYDYIQACEKISELFIRETTVPGALPDSIAEYWKTTYLESSSEPENEPTQKNIDILCAMLSFLEDTHEDEELLTDEDWRMLGELVNYEAADLPIEILQALMSTIVSKGVL